MGKPTNIEAKIVLIENAKMTMVHFKKSLGIKIESRLGDLQGLCLMHPFGPFFSPITQVVFFRLVLNC